MDILSETELADVIRSATGPLKVRGGGTRPVGHPVTGEVLDVSGMSGITLYEPGALTVVAKAGTPLAEVEAALAEEGQRLAFEPPDWRGLLGTKGTPTIGGIVAANASGPRRVQAGACRDALIGVRFVDGTGAVVKNGGRVMKNVTGYDLVKLMAGSWGTLGVLTEVAFKVLPDTAASATMKLRGLKIDRAVAAMSTALGSPFDVTGAAHADLADGGGPRTLIRIEGFATSVAYRAKRLADLLSDYGEVTAEMDRDRSRAIWQQIRDVSPFADKAAVWRISVKPGDAPELIRSLAARFSFDVLLDWGGGQFWLGADPSQLGATGPDADAAVRLIHAALQQSVAETRGHATLFKASESARRALTVFQPEAAPLAALSAGLRARFDPRGVLNPGLMG